jgi:hypothetical protein
MSREHTASKSIQEMKPLRRSKKVQMNIEKNTAPSQETPISSANYQAVKY